MAQLVFFLGFIKNLFNFNKEKKCLHLRVSPNSGLRFCPECGKEIEINWLILRCKNCNCKKHSYLLADLLLPTENYCVNCGNVEYIVEKLSNLNFYDIDYAVLKKEEIQQTPDDFKTQVWIQEEHNKEGHIAPMLISFLSR